MELRILCKRIDPTLLDGKFTLGEDSADIIGITIARKYGKHDLSEFSFRMTASDGGENAAIQFLEMDSFDEDSVHLLWTVTSAFTALAGKITLTLTGFNSDNSATVKFKSRPFTINSDETLEFLSTPEVAEQILQQVKNELKNTCESIDRKLSEYEINVATDTQTGGVKSGNDISVDKDGKVTVNSINGKTLENEIANVKLSQRNISALSVQIAHPNNFLIYDNAGNPSVMVAIPKFYLDEVINGASHTAHPAFIINGVEQDVIYISKYQNIVENGRAYSLPMKEPCTSINFDQAWNYCKNKGAGWHLMTNAEWAAIALWCKKNGTMPKGNNNYGKDISETNLPQKAIPSSKDGVKTGRVLTGSGPESWYHNGTFSGIADLNGNVWEWNSGLRLFNGEIQIIADNNAAVNSTDVSATSAEWKAIMPDGSLVAPGTAGTLKYKGNLISTSAASTGGSTDAPFRSITAADGVAIPEIMKALILAPIGTDYDDDNVWANATGEKISARGGRWVYGARSGIFTLSLNDPRSNAFEGYGFRSCYYNPV